MLIRYHVKDYDFNNDEAFQELFRAEYLKGKYQPKFATLLRKAKREWIARLNAQGQ